MPCRLALGLLLATAAGAAAGQADPYFIGASQTVTHQSNLLHLRDDQPLPAGLSRSDTVSSTALVAGLDQPIGRQRLYGSARLQADRYANNEVYDDHGYALDLALDWATIDRLSGTLSLATNRRERADLRSRDDAVITAPNAETRRDLEARAELGVVTPLTIVGTLMRRDVNYAAAESAYREYRQQGGSLGLRYRPGGSTTWGVALRQARIDYPNLLAGLPVPNDRRTQRSVDLTATWVPSAVSTLDARASRTRTRYEQFDERDFSAGTGSLGWAWQPTGKLHLDTRLSRDVGQDAEAVTNAFSRLTDTLRVRADFAASAKISLTATALAYRRSLDGNGQLLSGVTGHDGGHELKAGVRWAPLRSLSLGCDVGRERRGSNSNVLLDDAYSANTVGCFGQFMLQ